MIERDYLKSGEVARKLGLTHTTLRRWRIEGRGPEFYKTPTGHAHYPKELFEQWLSTEWGEAAVA